MLRFLPLEAYGELPKTKPGCVPNRIARERVKHAKAMERAGLANMKPWDDLTRRLFNAFVDGGPNGLDAELKRQRAAGLRPDKRAGHKRTQRLWRRRGRR